MLARRVVTIAGRDLASIRPVEPPGPVRRATVPGARPIGAQAAEQHRAARPGTLDDRAAAAVAWPAGTPRAR